MSVLSNFAARSRLIRIALTRRFIYGEVVAMAEAYGLEYRDLRADTEPFSFVRSVGGTAPPPDFAALGAPETFTPAGDPGLFNSEPSVARFLGELAFRSGAGTVVELGCYVGWTTAHLALAIQARGSAGRIFALDYQQRYLDVMRQNLARRGNLHRRVTPVQGMSLEAKVLAELPSSIDLVFLDTSHAYPATRDEILAYSSRLSPGGRLVLHDSINASGVRRSIDELTGRFHVLTFATERSNGVTVLQRRDGS